MKKFLTLFIVLVFASFQLFAQSSEYIVWFKNGSKLTCTSYSIAPDGSYIVEVDGIKYTYNEADVDMVTAVATPPAPSAVEEDKIELVDVNQQPQTFTYNPQVVVIQPVKSPALAGVLSFFIPGVGQFYTGKIGAGVGFLLGDVALLTTMTLGAAYGNLPVTLVGFLGALTIEIWSIVHAVNSAKAYNMQRGLQVGKDIYLNLEPTMLASNTLGKKNQYHYGASLSLSF